MITTAAITQDSRVPPYEVVGIVRDNKVIRASASLPKTDRIAVVLPLNLDYKTKKVLVYDACKLLVALIETMNGELVDGDSNFNANNFEVDPIFAFEGEGMFATKNLFMAFTGWVGRSTVAPSDLKSFAIALDESLDENKMNKKDNTGAEITSCLYRATFANGILTKMEKED